MGTRLTPKSLTKQEPIASMPTLAKLQNSVKRVVAVLLALLVLMFIKIQYSSMELNDNGTDKVVAKVAKVSDVGFTPKPMTMGRNNTNSSGIAISKVNDTKT